MLNNCLIILLPFRAQILRIGFDPRCLHHRLPSIRPPKCFFSPCHCTHMAALPDRQYFQAAVLWASPLSPPHRHFFSIFFCCFFLKCPWSAFLSLLLLYSCSEHSSFVILFLLLFISTYELRISESISPVCAWCTVGTLNNEASY